MSPVDFVETLELVLQEELGINDAGIKELLSIPGIYEALSKHYNNQVLEVWEINQEINPPGENDQPMKDHDIKSEPSISPQPNKTMRTYKDELCSIINTAISHHDLIIWNPVTKEILNEHDIEDACMWGDSIQINLSKEGHK